MRSKSYKKRRIHTKQKTTTKAGKREYMKKYMQRYRKEKKRKQKKKAKFMGMTFPEFMKHIRKEHRK